MNPYQSSKLCTESTARASTNASMKLPFDLAASTIEQIVSEILPKKLDLLDQHKRNVLTALNAQDQAKAKKEILRASLLVRQIKGDLTNLEEIKSRLHTSHHQAFDKMVNNSIKRASAALTDFNEVERKQKSLPTEIENSEVEEPTVLKLQVLQHPSELEEIEAYAKSVEKIQQDCEDIHSAYQTLSHIVGESAEVVNKVEDNIVNTEEHVKLSERSLAYCARKNLALSSLIGAFAGACVGGPIGLVIGAKVAAVAALGGGVLGYSGAKAFRRHQQKELDVIDSQIRESQS